MRHVGFTQVKLGLHLQVQAFAQAKKGTGLDPRKVNSTRVSARVSVCEDKELSYHYLAGFYPRDYKLGLWNLFYYKKETENETSNVWAQEPTETARTT